MGVALKVFLLALVFTNFSNRANGLLCTLLVGVTSFAECEEELDRSIKPFKTNDGRVPEFVFCCAITTFRYCIVDQIGKTCGTPSENLVNGIINTAVKTFKSDSDLSCNGNEFYYRKESPFCWAVWGHAAGAIALILILVLACCCCCCCFKSR